MKTLDQYQTHKARVFENTLRNLVVVSSFIRQLEAIDGQLNEVNQSTATKDQPYGLLEDTCLDYGIAQTLKALRERKDELSSYIKLGSKDQVF